MTNFKNGLTFFQFFNFPSSSYKRISLSLQYLNYQSRLGSRAFNSSARILNDARVSSKGVVHKPKACWTSKRNWSQKFWNPNHDLKSWPIWVFAKHVAMVKTVSATKKPSDKRTPKVSLSPSLYQATSRRTCGQIVRKAAKRFPVGLSNRVCHNNSWSSSLL